MISFTSFSGLVSRDFPGLSFRFPLKAIKSGMGVTFLYILWLYHEFLDYPELQ